MTPRSRMGRQGGGPTLGPVDGKPRGMSVVDRRSIRIEQATDRKPEN